MGNKLKFEIWNFGRTITIPTSKGGIEVAKDAGLPEYIDNPAFAAEFVGYPGISVRLRSMDDISRETLRTMCADREVPYDVKDSKNTLVEKWLRTFLNQLEETPNA